MKGVATSKESHELHQCSTKNKKTKKQKKSYLLDTIEYLLAIAFMLK